MTKYIVYVEVGDLPPDAALAYVEKVQAKVADFFEGSVLALPTTGRTWVQAIEIEMCRDGSVP